MRSAKLRLDTRKNLAAAYWEYLVAYHISVDAIPSHPDYYDKINQSRSQLHRDYRDLTKVQYGLYVTDSSMANRMVKGHKLLRREVSVN
jgi:hypothetical protein